MSGEIRRGRQAIAEVTEGGVQRLLDRLEERGFDPQEDRKGWLSLCPVHGDTNPSLAIDEGEDGQVLLYCRSHQCDYKEILEALDLEPKDLGSGTGTKKSPESTVEYVYVNEHGEPLRKVVRKPGKEFPQAWWNGKKWIWKDVAKNSPAVPYRLPEVLAAVEAGEIIYIAEGEKDVNALVEAGVTATCNPGGAGKWTDELSSWLQGGAVVVIRDKDSAGEKHGAEVAASLRAVDCEVLIAEAKVGKDAYDHLRMYSVDDLVIIDEEDDGGTEIIVSGEAFGPGDFDRAFQSYLDKTTRGPGPSLGFRTLDAYLNGQRGITVYVGPPKGYKSWLMVQAVVENIRQDKHPWIYPLELPSEETYMRMACMLGDVPWNHYIHGAISRSEQKEMKHAVEELEKEGAFQFRTPPQKERSIDELIEVAQEEGAGSIFVDQMQYVEVDGKSLGAWNKTEKYWEVLDRARNLTDSICFAHQFNMRLVTDKDKMPSIECIKGSSAFQEVATLVLGLWANKDMRKSGRLELGILAARNHSHLNWEVEVDLVNRCHFEIIGLVEDD